MTGFGNFLAFGVGLVAVVALVTFVAGRLGYALNFKGSIGESERFDTES